MFTIVFSNHSQLVKSFYVLLKNLYNVLFANFDNIVLNGRKSKLNPFSFGNKELDLMHVIYIYMHIDRKWLSGILIELEKGNGTTMPN